MYESSTGVYVSNATAAKINIASGNLEVSNTLDCDVLTALLMISLLVPFESHTCRRFEWKDHSTRTRPIISEFVCSIRTASCCLFVTPMLLPIFSHTSIPNPLGTLQFIYLPSNSGDGAFWRTCNKKLFCQWHCYWYGAFNLYHSVVFTDFRFSVWSNHCMKCVTAGVTWTPAIEQCTHELNGCILSYQGDSASC